MKKILKETVLELDARLISAKDACEQIEMIAERWESAIEILKQIRQLDIRHKTQTGFFFLPQNVREQIQSVLE